MEVLIKRNDPTVSEPRQSREIAICPKFLHETFLKRVFYESLIHSRGIQNETHPLFNPVSLVNIPCLLRRKGAAEDFRMRGQTQKSQCRHPAEGNFGRRLFTPVRDGFLMVDMGLVHQRQPDIHIGKIPHALLRRIDDTARTASISSAARIALSSRFVKTGVGARPSMWQIATGGGIRRAKPR